MEGRVWIAEDEEPGEDGWFLLGTFSGHHDTGGPRPVATFSGLSAEEAIRWGRERSEVVLIRLGRGDYLSAGDRDAEPGHVAWPPPDLPPLRRRRPPEDAWRDRRTADPPIEWRVVAELTPPAFALGQAFPLEVDPAWEATACTIAARAGADAWDGDELAGFLADVRRQVRGDGDAGWTSSHRPAYRLHLRCEASTPDAACSEVARRVGDVPGWEVTVAAAPAR